MMDQEKQLIERLQGSWEAEDGLPPFTITGRTVVLNKGIIGIGIPGLDNTLHGPLLVRFVPEFDRWQLFVDELGWVATFLDEIQESYFVVRHFDPESGAWSPQLRITRMPAS